MKKYHIQSYVHNTFEVQKWIHKFCGTKFRYKVNFSLKKKKQIHNKEVPLSLMDLTISVDCWENSEETLTIDSLNSELQPLLDYLKANLTSFVESYVDSEAIVYRIYNFLQNEKIDTSKADHLLTNPFTVEEKDKGACIKSKMSPNVKFDGKHKDQMNLVLLKVLDDTLSKKDISTLFWVIKEIFFKDKSNSQFFNTKAKVQVTRIVTKTTLNGPIYAVTFSDGTNLMHWVTSKKPDIIVDNNYSISFEVKQVINVDKILWGKKFTMQERIITNVRIY